MEIDIDEKLPEGSFLYRPTATRLGSGEDGEGKPVVILKVDNFPVVGWPPETAREIAAGLLREASLLDGKPTTVVMRDS